MQDAIDQLPFIYHDFVATYIFIGVQRNTEQFFASGQPMETQQDAEDYITRLVDVQRKFNDVIGLLSLQSGAGIVEPSITLNVAIFLLGEIANGAVETNYYFTTFETRLNDIAWSSDYDPQDVMDSARSAAAMMNLFSVT